MQKLVFTSLSLVIGLLAWYYSDYFLEKYFLESMEINNNVNTNHALFTLEELGKFNGITRKELYLAVLGNVFDVTKGVKHYGPGQQYHTFIGRDNSRSFVTGKFESEFASDDVIGLTEQELKSVNHWMKFYKKDYTKKGKLVGRYYNELGKLTPYGKEVRLLIKKSELAQKNDDLEKKKYPPCNIEWDANKGTRVWCTKRSGGIERDWSGFPRQFYEAGSDNERCACIHKDYLEIGNIKQYENCDNLADSCFVNLDKK